jgi:hypothetical protein
MTEIDERDDERLRMPVRGWSIQWVSIRILWGLFAAGFILWRINDPSDTAGMIAAAVFGAIVFVVLTVIARIDRRRWGREHADD